MAINPNSPRPRTGRFCLTELRHLPASDGGVEARRRAAASQRLSDLSIGSAAMVTLAVVKATTATQALPPDGWGVYSPVAEFRRMVSVLPHTCSAPFSV